MLHSDQGSKFSSSNWRDFLHQHNLQQSMSRRGNCHYNAVAESCFQLLKRESIRRKIFSTREEAKQDGRSFDARRWRRRRLRAAYSPDTPDMLGSGDRPAHFVENAIIDPLDQRLEVGCGVEVRKIDFQWRKPEPK